MYNHRPKNKKFTGKKRFWLGILRKCNIDLSVAAPNWIIIEDNECSANRQMHFLPARHSQSEIRSSFNIMMILPINYSTSHYVCQAMAGGSLTG